MNYIELLQYNRNRRICQVCFATYDLKKTLNNWIEKLGVGPWKVMKFSHRNVIERTMYGKPVDSEYEQYVALAMFGNIEIEIVCPISETSPLRDWMNEHGPGFHHMKEYCSSEERPRLEREYASRGVPILSTGKMPPDEFWFIDSEPLVDFKLECGSFAYLDESLFDCADFFWYPPKNPEHEDPFCSNQQE